MATAATPQAAVEMPAEQFQMLLDTIRALIPAPNAAAAAAEASKSKGSFSNCNARFGGERDNAAVDEFITAIETYKDVESITDVDALKGLPLLFYNIASTWWKGVQRDAKTWDDALVLLREYFCPSKPEYQIYMEIFDGRQQEGVAIDTFICEKRELLAKLPEGRHDEETELDFVFGLLLPMYRQGIARNDIKTFRELLEKGRAIEKHK